MKWCTINEDYLDYLKSIETRIPNYSYHQTRSDRTEKKLHKPFFYSLYDTGDYCYVGQVNHYRPDKHDRLREMQDFKKIYDATTNRPLCVVNLNYIFPVPKTELTELNYSDIDQVRDFDNLTEKSTYIDLLRKELAGINNKNLVPDVLNLFNLKKNRPDHIVARRCFDYELLEEKCLEWIAAKQSKNETFRCLSEQELLETNKKIRYDDADPNELINATFTVDNEEYKIKELEMLRGKTKDIALLERMSDGALFQDNDFASKSPLKLNLSPADKSNHLVTS
ncbi:MAG: type III toxin-antitoxin system ToxN/AbiQ family toxin [Anaeroplasma bactoclasticum]|nr:type III toxin-antitoxin system ToxN/AbiQ family toxin [Anaeroplasma bactoclasticum]